MTDDPGAPAGKGRRKPPTIDLTATEVGHHPSEAAAPGEPPAGDDVAAAGAAATAAPPEPAAAASEAAATSAGSAPPPSARPLPWPLVGAGAAGGAVVAIVLAIATALIVGSRDDEALLVRLAGLERQLVALAERPAAPAADAARLDELAQRVARLEAAAGAGRTGAADPALANRIASLEGSLKALGENVGVLGRRSDEIAAAARAAAMRADANAAKLAEIERRLAQPPAVARADFDALAGRVAALERAAKSLEAALQAALAKQRAAEADRPARLAVAATLLAGAVERGAPFAAELAAVKALAGDAKPIAALEPFAATGVPAGAALARELLALVPALEAASGAPPRDRGFFDRLAANAGKLVRIRPLDEPAGTDVAAIVMRIEVKAVRGDVAGALAELAQLPPDVRAPAEPWIAKAQARAAALEASRRLAADALAGLGK
jgi:hypothetical protein